MFALFRYIYIDASESFSDAFLHFLFVRIR